MAAVVLDPSTPANPLKERGAVIPSSFLPFEEFKAKFSLGETSTEKENVNTRHLSTVLSEDRGKGLSLLLAEEVNVIEGFKKFAPQLDQLAPELAERAKQGGRIIFIGVGSSGRLGLDLAAKVTSHCPALKCVGILGGGDGALIQAREGFEDSLAEGKTSAQKMAITALDTVFLISASGSASFNAGFGHEAANQGAKVFYFYNSQEVPTRTKELFTRINNPVIPLLLDIGPQAILGSTRLQGYSIGRVCLGYLLGQTLFHFENREDWGHYSSVALVHKLELALKNIDSQLDNLIRIIEEEYRVFSSPESNFRRARDMTSEGYVTLLGTASSLREELIDSVETSPTFFLNPRKREREDKKRRAEYQAYLVGESDNVKAWKTVLGRDPYFPEDWKEVDDFILAAEMDGKESFQNRPHGPGNFVLGVDVLHRGQTLSPQLVESLHKVKQAGGGTALLILSEDQLSVPEDLADIISVVQQEDDPLGIIFSQLLKWQLNLISNGTMILMGKVSGNRMIDLRTSNNKLIDRCMRLIHEQWSLHHPDEPLDDRKLYEMIIDVYTKQKGNQEQGEYTPSTLKLVLAMLEKRSSFEEATHLLREIGENIDQLY